VQVLRRGVERVIGAVTAELPPRLNPAPQGIGVYFLIPENYREIQEFNLNRPKV
jgi:hypothetical protein